jgi:hypothetical protein
MKISGSFRSKRPHITIEPGHIGDDGEVRYALSVGKRSYDIYFRSSNIALYSGVEPLLVLALLPAMRVGADLLPARPIGRDLSDNLARFMEIFEGWFEEYTKIDILGPRRDPAPPRTSGRVGVFFSGGVDSFYTLFRHQHEITDLINIHGFDITLDDHERRKAVSDMCRAVADRLGKGLVEVETNSKSMIIQYGEWGMHTFGATLACIGHSLSSEFRKIYIASSGVHQDALYPKGSHPDTDPLLGCRELMFIHDGSETDRPHKAEAICEHDIAMDHLRVCWESVEGTYNCGTCEKCLRTMIVFYAIGKLGRCRTFPEGLDTAAVRRLLYTKAPERIIARGNLDFLDSLGLQQMPVYTALQAALSRPLWLAKLIYAFKRSRRKLIWAIPRIPGALKKRIRKLIRLISPVNLFGRE